MTERQAYTQGDRVVVLALGTEPTIHGTVSNVRSDDRGVPLLTVTLDDQTLTPDGWLLARECEVLNEFQWRMVTLDCALTGRPAREVIQQAHHKPSGFAEWFSRGQEWYLSDGGYSRIWVDVLDESTIRLRLTSNSRPGPKAAWDGTAELRATIEASLKDALKA